MPDIGSGDCVPEFEGGRADQQIGERKTNSSGRVLPVDLPGAKSDRNRDGMTREGQEQLLNKLLPLGSPL